MTEVTHLTDEQIEAGLADVLASPGDGGRVEAIVIRPAVDERETLQQARLSPEGGVEGDRWATAGEPLLPDGRPDPRQQVSLMNARLLHLLAGDEARMALAGDNLVVDLDLSDDNLPPGQKLAVGGALIEMTDALHTGCNKFVARFGADATRYVNASQRKALHLRGRYARVLVAGQVQVGDTLRKVD
jgi:MOSC domain-containing protein YiiM